MTSSNPRLRPFGMESADIPVRDHPVTNAEAKDVRNEIPNSILKSPRNSVSKEMPPENIMQSLNGNTGNIRILPLKLIKIF